MRYLISMAILAIMFSTGVMAAEAMTGYELRLGISIKHLQKNGYGHQCNESITLTTPFGLDIRDVNVSQANFFPRDLIIGMIRPICKSPEATVSLGLCWSTRQSCSVPDYDSLVVAGRVNGKIVGNNYSVRIDYYIPTSTKFRYSLPHMFRLTDMYVERKVGKNIRLGITGDYDYSTYMYDNSTHLGGGGGNFSCGPRISVDAGKSATLNVSYLNWGNCKPQQFQTELVYRF